MITKRGIFVTSFFVFFFKSNVIQQKNLGL